MAKKDAGMCTTMAVGVKSFFYVLWDLPKDIQRWDLACTKEIDSMVGNK